MRRSTANPAALFRIFRIDNDPEDPEAIRDTRNAVRQALATPNDPSEIHNETTASPVTTPFGPRCQSKLF